jgi:hypothetical protein
MLWVRAAGAELADDVETLDTTFRKYGRVEVLPPRVVHQGNIVPIFVPEWATRGAGQDCTTLAVLGAMSTSFLGRFLPPANPTPWGQAETPQSSVAGALQIVRCGASRESLSRLVVEVRSPRGVLSYVVARGSKPMPPVRRVLPHRDPGGIAPVAPAGPRPRPAPLEDRFMALSRRYARERVAEIHRRLVPSGADGSARVLFDLGPGCHRIHVLGVNGDGDPGLDVDAELSFIDPPEFVASDRSDSPDAGLLACAGENRKAVLTFAGAPPSAPVLIVQARWYLPDALPVRWGPAARGDVGRAFFRHHLDHISGPPVFESLGIAGGTTLPIEIDPSACYVGVVMAVRGQVQLLSLSVTVGRNVSTAHATPGDAPPLVAFCGDSRGRAVVDVEAHGSSYYFRFALFETGRSRTSKAGQ